MKFYTKLLVLVIIFGILIYTFHNTIMALWLPTIHCDSDLEILVNFIVSGLRCIDPDNLIVILSNLEQLQDIVGVPQNGYDINDVNTFFEMLFQSQDLSVEFVNEVYVNTIKCNDIIYTVHPDFIYFIIGLFIFLEPILF